MNGKLGFKRRNAHAQKCRLRRKSIGLSTKGQKELPKGQVTLITEANNRRLHEHERGLLSYFESKWFPTIKTVELLLRLEIFDTNFLGA